MTDQQIAQLLTRADSVLSLIGYRYGTRLPADITAEAKDVSAECRREAERLIEQVRAT